MTIADNLTLLNSTKQDIKAAIEAKGVDMTDVPFTDYDTKIGEITTGGAIPIIPDYTPWTRNAQWLTLPTVNASDDEQIIMLVRVDNTTYNELIFSMQGAYTVDWGDGTVTNYASGAVAYRNYDYNNVALDGTLTSDGYKQAICKVTLQAAGTTFSRIDFNISTGKLSSSRTKPVLDMIIHSRNAATYLLGGFSTYNFTICERVELVTYDRTNAASLFSGFFNLQKLVLRNDALNLVQNTSSMFSDCYAIKEIPYFNVSGVTTSTSMFSSCYELVDIAAFNFAYTTISAGGMFQACYSLVDLRHVTLANPTTLAQAFQTCYSLEYLPTFGTMANCTSYSSAFNACYSLLEVPTNLNMSAATNLTSAFFDCKSLKELPAITITNPSAASMFSGCNSLKKIGTLTANSLTSGTSIFNQCFSLDLSNVNMSFNSLISGSSMFSQVGSSKITFTSAVNMTGSVNSMFAGSNAIRLRDLVINANFVGVTDCGSMFSGQQLLDEINITTFTTNGTASTTNMFSNCFNLKKLILGGFNQTFTIAGCSLGATELDALYTSLGTVTGKTITVTGNPGTTGDNPSIATAKGWTVTG